MDSEIPSGDEITITLPSPEKLIELIPKPRFECVCENVGEGFIWGCLLGTAFDFFKGMYDSGRDRPISGGCKAVRKKACRFGPSAAAHFGVLAALDILLPGYALVHGAAAFGIIRFIRSRKLVEATQSAFMGVFIISLMKAFAEYA